MRKIPTTIRASICNSGRWVSSEIKVKIKYRKRDLENIRIELSNSEIEEDLIIMTGYPPP